MHKRWSALMLSVLMSATLAGCGKGVDAKLSTSDEQVYRASLEKAFPDMTPDQQEAYNAVVAQYNFEQFKDKYSNPTPREIIEKEVDAYVAQKIELIAAITEELKTNAVRLASEERIVADTMAELMKIVATGHGIEKGGMGKEFKFTVQNNSQYDVSSQTFNSWLFIDGEEKSDRLCKVFGYYKHDGGLAKGRTLNFSYPIGGMNCSNWDTLEVRNAKQVRFKMELDPSRVKDFADKMILPRFSPTRADYENRIKAEQERIENAKLRKATLT